MGENHKKILENTKQLLRAQGVLESELYNSLCDIYDAMTALFEQEDARFVAEQMEVALTDTQLKAVLAKWHDLEHYGRLDRESIETAIEQVLEEQ